jgi:hypothetical protein
MVEVYIFQSALHKFQAIVDPTTMTIRIGGFYDNCLNMAIMLGTESACISHIQSEPECTLDTILESGEAVEMLKASIQFVKEVYPMVKTITLDDMSRIDCNIEKDKRGKSPPRRLIQPMSLAHLSIAVNKQTWYEKHFGAVIADPTLHELYRRKIERLDKPISLSFEDFIKRNNLNDVQTTFFRPLYSTSGSWHEMFKRVPTALRCIMFFNWLTFFLNMLIENGFNSSMWSIDIESMPKTDMKIVSKRTALSPALLRVRHTRRSRRSYYALRNDYGHTIL